MMALAGVSFGSQPIRALYRGAALLANFSSAPPAARSFDISPAVSGRTTWGLDADGPLTLGGAGIWTIMPHAGFAGDVELWGAGGGSGGHGATTATAGGTGGTTTFAGLTANGGAGSLGRTNNTAGPGAAGGAASGGDINSPGSTGGTGTISNNSTGGSGGASPNGGGATSGTSGSNGVSSSGIPGNPPGGGASGGARGSTGATQAQRRSVGGAGGGSYTKKTYVQGALPPGNPITLTIGSSGVAGTGDQAGGSTGAPGGAKFT